MSEMLARILATQERMLDERKESDQKMDEKLERLGDKLEAKIEKVIEPIKDRLDGLEKKSEKIDEELDEMRKKMEKMEKNAQEKDKEVEIVWPSQDSREGRGSNSGRVEKRVEKEKDTESRKRKIDDEDGNEKERRKIMEKASRTLSFFPIPIEEVDKICEELEENEENDGIDVYKEALYKAVEEFVVGELAITEAEWKNMRIQEIFTPRSEKWRTVYIELETQREADWIQSMTKNIKKGQKVRVANHTPWQARERSNAIEEKAMEKRKEKMRTRISIRNGDYSLRVQKREPEGEPWLEIRMENLPPFTFSRNLNSDKRDEAMGRKMRTSKGKHSLSPASSKENAPYMKKPKQTEDAEETEELAIGVEEGNTTMLSKSFDPAVEPRMTRTGARSSVRK